MSDRSGRLGRPSDFQTCTSLTEGVALPNMGNCVEKVPRHFCGKVGRREQCMCDNSMSHMIIVEVAQFAASFPAKRCGPCDAAACVACWPGARQHVPFLALAYSRQRRAPLEPPTFFTARPCTKDATPLGNAVAALFVDVPRVGRLRMTSRDQP